LRSERDQESRSAGKARVLGVAIALGALAIGAGAVLAEGRFGASRGAPLYPLPVTPEDIFERGTQPIGSGAPPMTMIGDPIVDAGTCMLCHAGFDDPATTVKPYRWRGSMHSHSFRDPIFQAAMTIANQDAPGAGSLCIKCHAPRGWLEGRGSPPTGNPDGSSLFFSDIDEGVGCNVCHRLVDPVYPRVSYVPSDDEAILAVLDANGLRPLEPGNAKMVVDGMDIRRGPFDDAAAPHAWAHSPFHTTGNICGTCHDVSNPLLSRIGGMTPAPSDTYALNGFNAAHPTGLKHDQFPEQRTFSEWANSAFATTGVDMGGRFNVDPNDPDPPPTTVVSSCQDCHMPNRRGFGCAEFLGPPERRDVPYHAFLGANVFAIDLLLHLHGPSGDASFDAYTVGALERQRVETIDMVQKATDAEVTQEGGDLKARIINQCGHKLLTGMPEGRRIWKNVQFFAGETLIAERGGYDALTATLDEPSTKVYEQVFGLDASMAATTGKPAGKSFNLLLVNSVLKDNRIPPRGFTNAAFEAVQAGHVGYEYADGAYWDDSKFCIPAGADRAVFRLYYQTSSREYIEFLRDENMTDTKGQTLYDAWVAVGKSTPVIMDEVEIMLDPFVEGDCSANGVVDFDDIVTVLGNWLGVGLVGRTGGDANCDGIVNFDDLVMILALWGDSLP